jgi:Major royal jelly protein
MSKHILRVFPLSDRTLYFHALASAFEFSVSNSVLKNETFCTSPDSFHNFKVLGNRGSNTQSSAEVFDGLTGVVFYTQINRDAIGCWNTFKPYTRENQGLVASDSELLVFPNDLRIDSEGNLLALSNRMPVFIYKKLNEDFNYRIFMGKTSEIIKGTPCEN